MLLHNKVLVPGALKHIKTKNKFKSRYICLRKQRECILDFLAPLSVIIGCVRLEAEFCNPLFSNILLPLPHLQSAESLENLLHCVAFEHVIHNV